MSTTLSATPLPKASQSITSKIGSKLSKWADSLAKQAKQGSSWQRYQPNAIKLYSYDGTKQIIDNLPVHEMGQHIARSAPMRVKILITPENYMVLPKLYQLNYRITGMKPLTAASQIDNPSQKFFITAKLNEKGTGTFPGVEDLRNVEGVRIIRSWDTSTPKAATAKNASPTNTTTSKPSNSNKEEAKMLRGVVQDLWETRKAGEKATKEVSDKAKVPTRKPHASDGAEEVIDSVTDGAGGGFLSDAMDSIGDFF